MKSFILILQILILTALIAFNAGPSFAQNDINSKVACQAALADADIHKLAERLTSATMLEDVKFKSQALTQVFREIKKLENQFGPSIWKQVETIANQLQSTAIKASVSETQIAEGKRVEEQEVFSKWTRFKRIGRNEDGFLFRQTMILAPQTQRWIVIGKQGIEIYNLEKFDEPPLRLSSQVIDSRSTDVPFSLTADETALVWSGRVFYNDSPPYYRGIELSSAKPIEFSPPTPIDNYPMKFTTLSNGKFLLMSEFDLYVYRADGSLENVIRNSGSPLSSHILAPSSDDKYVFLLDGSSQLSALFDVRKNELITTQNLWPANIHEFAYDSQSEMVHLFEHSPFKGFKFAQTYDLRKRRKVWFSRMPKGHWSETLTSGDNKVLVLSGTKVTGKPRTTWWQKLLPAQLSSSSGTTKLRVELYDLKRRSQIELPSEWSAKDVMLLARQKGGPLLLLSTGIDPKETEYYLFDTSTKQLTELPALTARVTRHTQSVRRIWRPEITPDGKGIVFYDAIVGEHLIFY